MHAKAGRIGGGGGGGLPGWAFAERGVCVSRQMSVCLKGLGSSAFDPRKAGREGRLYLISALS